MKYLPVTISALLLSGCGYSIEDSMQKWEVLISKELPNSWTVVNAQGPSWNEPWYWQIRAEEEEIKRYFVDLGYERISEDNELHAYEQHPPSWWPSRDWKAKWAYKYLIKDYRPHFDQQGKNEEPRIQGDIMVWLDNNGTDCYVRYGTAWD